MSDQAALTRLATSLPSVLRELRRSPEEARPLALSGPPPLPAQLKALLTRGGSPAAVGTVPIDELGRPELRQAAAIVYVREGAPTRADEEALRRAERQGVPLLCLVVSAGPLDRILPYVRATDVVVAPALEQALAPLAARIARRCPDDAWGLAAELPVLREAVEAELVRRTARQNALLGAATFAAGSELPVLTLNEVRMVARVLGARGVQPARAAPAALLGAGGAALVLRALARALRGRLSLPDWAINAAVAYAGTRALGEAARRGR